jgi:hypothetical protein
MDIKELLDEDAFDPKKLFSEEEYSTLIIKRDGFSKKQNDTADIVEQLLEKDITRAESEAIYARLKDMKASAILLEALGKSNKVEDKAKLVAACWESGIDFTKEIQVFVELVCQPDLQLSVEALSVIESTESLSNEQIENALSFATSSKEGNSELKAALIEHLNAIKNA